ncbi:MAG: hypothetical protein ACI4JC_03915 [Faecalibacterium sp.]
MKLTSFDLDVSKTDVYGVVMTTENGGQYPLRHIINIWRGTELGFSLDDTVCAGLAGQTVKQIVYYTSDGAYEIPVTVEIPVLE